MQEMVRIESRLRLDRLAVASDEDPSVAELVKRLAQESRDLAAVEMQRLRVEMRDQARRAGRAAAAGYLAIDFVGVASLALAVGVFLLLADAWNSYTAAAFATSGLLAVIALCAALVMRGMMKRIGELRSVDAADAGVDRERK